MIRLNLFKTILLFISFGLSLSTQAADTPPACKSTPWPFSEKQSSKNLIHQMELLDRKDVVAYYFGELTNPKTTPKLIHSLGLFLSSTEQSESLRALYKVLEKSAFSETDETKKNPISLSELCSAHKKAEELAAK